MNDLGAMEKLSGVLKEELDALGLNDEVASSYDKVLHHMVVLRELLRQLEDLLREHA